MHPAVKRCFSYCAIFPKDFNIKVDDLIRIWMAQGFFLYSSGASSDMELKGQEYFEDLAMRSFFQDFKIDWVRDYRVAWCKMHDLVHDFSQYLTNNECLTAENVNEVQNEAAWVKNVRHLNLMNVEAKTTMDLFSRCLTEKLCSLMCTRNEIPLNLFSNLKRVKLLKLEDCNLKDVPMEIGRLVHIRYLNLSQNSLLEKLPESICDLYNLQTLNLIGCFSLVGLPEGIHKLVNLRHLLVHGTKNQLEFTQGLEKLINLRTLDRFACIRGSENNLGYLKDLNLLGRCLRIDIFDLDDAYDHVVEAKKGNLRNKTFIQYLRLYCVDGIGLRVLDALQPSPNLLRLDFKASYLPNWMTTLINLRELDICRVGNENGVLNSLRGLPFLERLTLSVLKVEGLSLEFFGLSTSTTTQQMDVLPSPAFPKLMHFSLLLCGGLKEWDDIKEEDEADTIISILPCLHHLEISSCLELKALPHRLLHKAALSLQTLEIVNCRYLEDRYGEGRGEDWDKIAHIPHVYIK